MNGIAEVEHRDLLLFSSTSYTPDEDFDLVIDALKQISDKIQNTALPGIHLVVTGKGPLKAEYEEKFEMVTTAIIILD